MKQLGQKLAIVLIGVFCVLGVGLAAPTYAANPVNPLNDACKNANAQSSAVCQQAAGEQNSQTNPVITDIAKTARVISAITGVASVIILVAGGIGFITSAGNAEAVTNARKRIMSAIIGLAISASAYLIISFVISRVL